MKKILVDSLPKLKKMIRCLKELAHGSDITRRAFAVDTETFTPGDKKKLKNDTLIIDRGRIMFISIAIDGICWGIPLDTYSPAFLKTSLVMAKLAPVMSDKRIRKVMHHANYDVNMFMNHGVYIANMYCTLIAGHCWNENLPNSLKERCVLIGMRLKRTSSVDFSDMAALVTYACDDAIATWKLYLAYEEGRKTDRFGDMQLDGIRREFFEKLEMPLLPHIIHMERRGFKINRKKLARIDAQIVAEKERIAAKIYVRNGAPFNLRSRAQLATFLFDKLGLESVKDTPTGKPCVDKFSMAQMLNQSKYVRLIDKYNKLESQRRFTGPKTGLHMYCDESGRIHCTFNQIGARTNRASCIVGTSLVETQDGPKQIQDVKVGDKVITHVGRCRNVLAVLNQGEQATYRILLDNGQVLVSNSSHRLLGPDGWRRTHELSNGDTLYTLRKDSSCSCGNTVQEREDKDADGANRKVVCPSHSEETDSESRVGKSRDTAKGIRCNFSDVPAEVCGGMGGKEFLSVCQDEIRKQTRTTGASANCSSEKEVSAFSRVSSVCAGDSAEVQDNGMVCSAQHKLLEVGERRIVYGNEQRQDGRRIDGSIGQVESGYTEEVPAGNGMSRCVFRGTVQDIRATGKPADVHPSLQEFALVEQATQRLEVSAHHTERRRFRTGVVNGVVEREDATSPRIHLGGNESSAGLLLSRSAARCRSGRDVACSSGGNRIDTTEERLVCASQHKTVALYKHGDNETDAARIAQDSDCFEEAKVVSVEVTGQVKTLWDLSVEEDESYIANGFVNHNCSNPNLQQMPSKTDIFGIRTCFIAGKGNCLIVSDKDQLELRLIAIWSRDKMLLRAYKRGLSIHLQTGALCGLLPKNAANPNLTKEEKDAIKQDKGYYISKNANFGLQYEGTGYTLWRQLLLEGIVSTPEDCEEIKYKYFTIYEDVPKFRQWLYDRCRKRGHIVDICGRPYVIQNIDSPHDSLRKRAERQCINTCIQASGASVIKHAMLEAFRNKELRELGFKLVLQIHDELVFEGPEKNKEKAMPIIKRLMEARPSRMIFKDIPIELTASVAVGKNWKEAKG